RIARGNKCGPTTWSRGFAGKSATVAAIVFLAVFCRFQGASFVRSFHRQAGQSRAQAVPPLFHSWRYGQRKSCGIHLLRDTFTSAIVTSHTDDGGQAWVVSWDRG